MGRFPATARSQARNHAVQVIINGSVEGFVGLLTSALLESR